MEANSFSLSPGSPARVEPMQSVRTTRGNRVRLECKASARPPPRISWYKDGKPVADIALRRFRVQNFRLVVYLLRERFLEITLEVGTALDLSNLSI